MGQIHKWSNFDEYLNSLHFANRYDCNECVKLFDNGGIGLKQHYLSTHKESESE